MNSARRRFQPHSHVEFVLLGYRVETEPQLVAAGQSGSGERSRVERHLGAAVGDLDRSSEAQQMTIAGNSGVDRDPLDPETADVDIDVRKQRRVRVAGPQLRQPQQSGRLYVDRADVDMIAEISERAIIELRFGRREEQPLRIPELEIVDCQFAEHRPFDPADIDIETRGRLHRIDLADDVASPHPGVEPEDEAKQEEQHGAERDCGPFDRGPGPTAADRGFDGIVLRHQKAWPIDM